MIGKFKSFFNKDNFEYSTGFVNPYEFHTFFSRISKAFLVLDDGPIAKMNYLHTFMLVDTAFSIFISILCFYGGFKTLDIIKLTEAGTYIILFTYTFLILIFQRINRKHYHKFFKALREDFRFVCSEDGMKYRSSFFENQLITWKLCICCFFFKFVGIFLVICSVLILGAYLMTRNPENDTGRPLLFPIWLFDKDVTSTPYYEFFFIYTGYTMIIVGFTHTYNTQAHISWVREITAKADLIINAIEDLMDDIKPTNDPEERAQYDNLLKQRLRNIVIQHHSMFDLLEDFAGVYKKLLMLEQILGGPVMCFTAYASLEKFTSDRELQPVLILLFVATFTVCVIPSYMCTVLGEKVHSISDACWNTPFWNASPVIRPYMVLIMQRSLRPLPLQAPGFQDVSLQTFSGKMAAAYSMFNMLRQTNLGSSLNN